MLVKVHNTNTYPYTEEFRGNKIVIPPMGFVEMDEDEADYFMQTFTFPKKDSQGRPDPLFFKKLKLEKPKVEATVDPLLCHATGQKAATPEEFAKVMASVTHMLHKDEAGEADLKRQNVALKKSNQELKSRLEAIEERLGLGKVAEGAA
jgi:hypothetical protein